MRKLLVVTLLCVSIGAFSQNQPNESILDSIDFSNAELVGTDWLANTIVDYISSCGNTINSAHCQLIAAKNIVMSASVNVDMYNFVLRGLIEVFDAMGKSKIVDYLSDMPYAPIGEMTDEQISSLKAFAESYRKIRIGCSAPSFEWETIDGQKFILSNETGYCVLSFISLDCNHCKEWLIDVNSFVKEHSEYKLVIWMVNGSSREMKRFMRRNKINNVVCLTDSMRWGSPIVNDYCVSSTPSSFIIDENMIIVDKPETIEDLYTFVNNHQK